MQATEITDRHELHGVQAVLCVPDVAATIAYYRDTLGFHVDFEHVWPSAARVRFERSATPGTPRCYLYVHVGQRLDDLFAVYRERGVKIVGEPRDRPWGLRQFEVQDCNGYLLTFVAEL